MKFQKLKWEYQKKQRSERKRLKAQALEMGFSSAGGRGRPMTAMSTFLQRQARSMLDHNWQIIQVGRFLTFLSILVIRLANPVPPWYHFTFCWSVEGRLES